MLWEVWQTKHILNSTYLFGKGDNDIVYVWSERVSGEVTSLQSLTYKSHQPG